MNKIKKIYHYFWDIGSGEDADTRHMYKVEYNGKTADKISYKQVEMGEARARRKCFEITGKRKCLGQRSREILW